MESTDSSLPYHSEITARQMPLFKFNLRFPRDVTSRTKVLIYVTRFRVSGDDGSGSCGGGGVSGGNRAVAGVTTPPSPRRRHASVVTLTTPPTDIRTPTKDPRCRQPRGCRFPQGKTISSII